MLSKLAIKFLSWRLRKSKIGIYDLVITENGYRNMIKGRDLKAKELADENIKLKLELIKLRG